MIHRIQKLLVSDFSNLNEKVLVEGPFAEVTETGEGIRQVQIALTTNHLLIAIDIFEEETMRPTRERGSPKSDPEFESLKLVKMFPVHCISIQTIVLGDRLVMEVTTARSKVMFYEFGGHILKHIYWNLWRKRIEALNSSAKMSRTYQSSNNSVQHFPNYSSSFCVIDEKAGLKVSEDNSLETTSKQSYGSVTTTGLLNQSAIDNNKTSSMDNLRGNDCYQQDSLLWRMETQSEIIKQVTSAHEICDGSCRLHKMKAISNADIEQYWNYY